MSEEISASDIFARIYRQFCPHSFSPEESRNFLVRELTEPGAERILRTLKNSHRFPKMLLMTQGGCGTSEILRQVSENSDLISKRNVIFFSLAEEINLADAEIPDILFAVYSRIIRAMPDEDFSSPLDDLLELTEPVFDRAGIKERDMNLLPAVSVRMRTDAAFRQSLREKLRARSEDLRRYTEKLCRHFSRTTYDCFRLSDLTFARLREEDVSDNILSKLEEMKDREYKSEIRFLKSIEEKIGEVQALHYKDRILKQAWSEEPADLLLLLDDGDKLEPRAAEKIFLEEFSDLMMPGAGIVCTAPLHIFHSPLFSHVKKDICVETVLPLRVSDAGGNPDISALALLKEAAVKRINTVFSAQEKLQSDSAQPALPFTEEALVFLIGRSGGVLRDLNTLIRTCCKIAFREKTQHAQYHIDEKTAGAAVTDMAETCMRFLDFEEYGEAVKKIIRSKSVKGTGSKTLGYLLKYRFVLEYGGEDEPLRFDAHPWLKEALNRIS